jgi:hypothetical protein
MQYRQDSGEEIHGNSWVMRRLWIQKKDIIIMEP